MQGGRRRRINGGIYQWGLILGTPRRPCQRGSAEHLHDVAVGDLVVAADALAVEPRRRAPDPGADEASRRGRGGPSRRRRRPSPAGRARAAPRRSSRSCRRRTRISPVSAPDRVAERLERRLVEDRDRRRPRGPGTAAARRVDGARRRPRRRGSRRGTPASRCRPRATSARTARSSRGVGAGPGAVDDRVGRAEDAEQRPAAAAVLGRALDQPRDLDELDEHAADPGQRRAPAGAS